MIDDEDLRTLIIRTGKELMDADPKRLAPNGNKEVVELLVSRRPDLTAEYVYSRLQHWLDTEWSF
jgi:hypothetical protein